MKKKILLLTGCFLLMSTPLLSGAQGIDTIVTEQLTQFKVIMKSVMVAGIILGVVTGIFFILWDFKDSKVTKQVLIGILIASLLMALTGALVSYANSISW